MSKNKINFNQKTKLSSVDAPKKMDIIKSGEVSRTKSFRFTTIDIERLSNILNTANSSCNTKRLTETDVIRSLLVAGETLTGDKLISCLRKSFV